MNDSFAELFDEGMRKAGFKRIPVGLGQLKAATKRRAFLKSKKSSMLRGHAKRRSRSRTL